MAPHIISALLAASTTALQIANDLRSPCLDDFDVAEGWNCYEGAGGVPIDDDDSAPVGLSAEQCIERCTNAALCDCVTYSTGAVDYPGKCWMRSSCNPSQYVSEVGYTVYKRNCTGPSPLPPSPSPTDVFSPSCEWAAPGWPIFQTQAALQADATWSEYFTRIYGEVPASGYPICVGALNLIWQAGGLTEPQAKTCRDSTFPDGTLVDRMSACCDPRTSTFILNSLNIGHVVPDNNWAEVMHVTFAQDKGPAWYYLAFGSAVWLNVGRTMAFKEHADVTKFLLGTECKDDVSHKTTPHTECEQDFESWYSAAKEIGLDTFQITDHYDCMCGTPGQSSWKHNRRCQTEIVDPNGRANHGGCASASYRAGWQASQTCDCDETVSSTNCVGFGPGSVERDLV